MKTLLLHISGLHCEDCVPLLTRRLRAVEGTRGVVVDVFSHSARVNHDERLCAPRDLVAAIEGIGFQVDSFESSEIAV